MSNSLTLFALFLRSTILVSFVMILARYNFLSMRRFHLPLRLLALVLKSGLLAMIAVKRYVYYIKLFYFHLFLFGTSLKLKLVTFLLFNRWKLFIG